MWTADTCITCLWRQQMATGWFRERKKKNVPRCILLFSHLLTFHFHCRIYISMTRVSISLNFWFSLLSRRVFFSQWKSINFTYVRIAISFVHVWYGLCVNGWYSGCVLENMLNIILRPPSPKKKPSFRSADSFNTLTIFHHRFKSNWKFA